MLLSWCHYNFCMCVLALYTCACYLNHRNENPGCVQFWQYGDITYPVNVMPAMDYEQYYNSGHPLPAMLPIAAPQNGLYANLASPETLQQEINPHQYYQGCMYPPFILPFHHLTPQFVQHENQLYPSLHGNYYSFPPQGNAPPAQNIQFKDPIHSQHLMPSVNTFSFPRQPRDFLLGSIDCDTFFIENRKSGVSGYASASFKECALSHPLGNIIKTKRAVHCHFILDSGVQW